MTSSCHVTRCVVMATLLLTSSHGRLRHQKVRNRPTFHVEEQLPVGHVVGSVADVMTSQYGGRSFSLLAAHSQDIDDEKSKELFSVNSETGAIETTMIIDREQVCNTVRTSSCVVSLDVAILPRFDVVTVDIEIQDINDHAPSFSVNITTRHVIESAAPGPVFLLPVAVDQDGGDSGSVEYRLVPARSPFRLVVGEGAADLTVELVETLDRETTERYHLTLTAVDAGSPPLSASLSLVVIVDDVNDNSPQFDVVVYNASLSVPAPVNSFVVCVSARDVDSGLNAQVRYRFAAKTQARYGGMFSIDAQSGNITTSSVVDFATSSEIKLVVLASDLGHNAIPTSTTVIIRPAELNQHAPVILVESLQHSHLQHLTVAENSPQDTFIAHVLVSDADFGSAGEVECLLQAENDDAQNFRLAPLFLDTVISSYRTVHEYKLVSGSGIRFDRENRSVYDISLVCRDFGEPAYWVRQMLVVEVTDVDDNVPLFGVTLYNFTVAENNRRGQIIGRVSASDADEGPNARVTYSLGADSESSAWFDVDPSSGVVTARVSFDREFVNHFHFTIFVSSVETSSSSQVAVDVTVTDVDDEVARFDRSWYRFDVVENERGGTVVGVVSAIDLDLPPFNSFHYQLDTPTGDDSRQNGAGDFVVDPETGIIYTRRPLDRETLSHYTLRVRAQNDVTSASDESSDVTVVFIQVVDVNDHAPEVTYPLPGNEVHLQQEAVRAGVSVAMVTAEDADVGENSRLAYSIYAGDETGMFTIADSSGLITWSDLANDNLTICSWTLSIRVTDHGNVKQLWTDASLVVVVDDCVVDNVVHVASRQYAADLGPLFITDWHVFVVIVAIAACVVVVGSLLTVVVALRHCRRRRRQKRPTTTTTSVGDGVPGREDGEGDIMLKLVPSSSQNSSSDSVTSSCGKHVVLVLDELHSHRDVSQSLLRALQQARHQLHGPLQDSCRLQVITSRDIDRDSGYVDLSPLT